MHVEPALRSAPRPSHQGQAGPRAPTFVPHGLLHDAPRAMLPLALHRTRSGPFRPLLSAELLAAAIRSGAVECDPVSLRWTPPRWSAEAYMKRAWGRRTGHEGAHHRVLRGAAVPLLAALLPGAELEAERTWLVGGRSIKVDLAALGGGGAIVAEVGTVEGDAILALLLPRRRQRVQISHVVVLPFAGARNALNIDGYAFRLGRTAPIGSPSKTDLRTAWAAVLA